ncbi:hypothetical protein [Nonomuraea jabiensis]|uniref:PHD/YefM family antitoxin component YafN of YafNO toxin-antitoxin module n=1 Tax=Nonomuraea jabiensis TaxID=882448 RepID=A0A7W9LEJ9_9ACTN|nr:hypothetical protein [Nonomuraea jabiensis]MBB5780927.1 PHD/YefM family antitoxin component YafN of YafNO toxin-antitoxin module [Nonomuraea jabiensis]
MVVDPEVPPDDAQLLRESRRVLLKMRQGWVPESRRAISIAQYRVMAAFGSAALFGMMVGGSLVGRGLGLLMIVLLGIPLMIVLFVRNDLSFDGEEEEHERKVYEQLRWYEGRYVLIDDLDESSARLLARAQRAIAAVTESRINAEGLLDDVRNAVMLPAQEWEIARLLAKLSALRTKHRETVSKGLTPEVEAVAEPLARALDNSEAAVLARVEALERYASNVADAERAYQAHHQIEELRGRLHQYEELVAETGADGFAVPELERLAQDADRLEQALRRSVTSAHEAFRYLDP